MIFCSLGRSGFHGCFDDFSLDLNFGLIIFVFRVHLAALEGAMPNLQVKKICR